MILLKNYSDVNVLRFDTDSGFDIDDLSNGAKVKMNSTFKLESRRTTRFGSGRFDIELLLLVVLY